MEGTGQTSSQERLGTLGGEIAMRAFISVLVVCSLVLALVAGAVAQQAGSQPNPKPAPTGPQYGPGVKPASTQPARPTQPPTPSPGVAPPGGVPTLPLPSAPTPGMPLNSLQTPGVGPTGMPNYGPATVPGYTLPAGPLGSPLGAMPSGAAMPSAPTPSYQGGVGQGYQGTMPYRPVAPAMPTTAMFSDPIYGPYVPTSPGIGYTPSFGTVNPIAPTATYEKPFSDYVAPPTYSPYMNLYRFNPRGPIDNYYSLVRPMVQQNTLNQQYRGQLQGLQMNNQLQRTMIQRLQQQNQALQGTYQPGYYQNQGGYYQNY